MALFPIRPVIVASALLAIVASSMAESNSFENVNGGINYLHYFGRDGQPSFNSYLLSVGSNIFNDDISVDLRTEFGDEQDSTNTYNLLEAGLRGQVQIPSSDVFSVYVRAAAGQFWQSVDTDFPFWSIEPGVSVNFSNTVTGNFGYRYRNAFDSNKHEFESNTAVVAIEWMPTRNHGINILYQYAAKDQKYDMVGIGYAYSF
ncbi:hypothetical protein CKO25_17800 [Thiocapsa imhoffii]|uniref:Outer membrane protein beta-barrel domain-containing protein n=1 Tax=Thiocapsa imhoffii TaxID=382777 RepID=A0A9X0WKK5_9GAMM|nr:outer membrane beta-barrel protein [Thiocapsa imhoffii]MBK1646467.1 hypothetical protein [Thiocapsa imhoffii]